MAYRATWLIVLLSCLLLGAGSASAQEGATDGSGPDEPLFIEAERLERRGDITIATGNVSIEFQGIRLDCQRLTYDTRRGLVTADSEVLFSWGDNFAAAESLTLDLRTNEAVLLGVAGKGEGLSVSDQSFEGALYFWADRLQYLPDRVVLDRAVLTTCDLEPNSLHYRINSEEITVYPDQQVVAKNTNLAFGDTQLYTLPTLLLPLDGRKRRQGYFPIPGYSNLYGAILRSGFDYSFDRRSYGTLNLDLYSRSGIGYGLEHFFDLGELGDASVYLYNQRDTQPERNRYQVRADANINIDEFTKLALSYNANRFVLPGLSDANNMATNINLGRYTPRSSLIVGANYSKSGRNDNRSYRAYYELDLSDRWTLVTSADIASSSSPVSRTDRFHYLGSLRHRADLFEGDLTYERTHGRHVYFLNRQPELRLQSYPLQLGFLPLTVGGSFGVLQESPSNFRTERYRFDLRVPDQIIETDFGSFHAGAGFRQSLYGSGQEQYLLGARVGWTQDFADTLLFRFDYNWQDSQGFTPFQNDLNFRYQVLTGGVELYRTDLFRVSASGAYDLNYSRAYDLVTRFDVNPVPGWELTAGANLDPNTGVWRTVDSGVTAKLGDSLGVTHWSIYDLVNGRLTYQNFSVSYESHDWIGSITYRGVQNELFFQMSLKAFPLRPIKVGPDPALPILPKELRDAFTR